MIKKSYLILERTADKKYYLGIYRLIKIYLNLFYPLYIKLVKNKGVDDTSNIIVSLTSFPARIDKVYLVIESILRQSLRPKKIVLWLALDQFREKKLPRNLTKLEKYGLEIKYCEDLRSHKKYFYSMIEFPENAIITIDDDTLYPEDLIDTLHKSSVKYPDTIISMLAHEIVKNDIGKIMPYNEWNLAIADVKHPSHMLVAIGCEGILYPPNVLHQDVFDKSFFMQNCKNADDLWLKVMAVMNDTKVMTAKQNPFIYVDLLNSQQSSLNQINKYGGDNDRQLENILHHYPEVLSRFI